MLEGGWGRSIKTVNKHQIEKVKHRIHTMIAIFLRDPYISCRNSIETSNHRNKIQNNVLFSILKFYYNLNSCRVIDSLTFSQFQPRYPFTITTYCKVYEW